MITTQYKGFTIEFLEQDEQWKVQGDNYSRTFPKYKGVKDYIDSICRREFKRFQCLLRGWGVIEYTPVTITSIMEDRLEAWYVGQDEKRGKAKVKDLFEDNDTNKQLILKITDVVNKQRKMDKDIGELAKQMTKIEV